MHDYGSSNLAIGTVALTGLLTNSVWLARATRLAAVVANLPHQVYHQTHLEVLPTRTDQVLQTITLSFVSLTAITLAILAFRLPRAGSAGSSTRSVGAAPTADWTSGRTSPG
jgi:hypothetical protein